MMSSNLLPRKNFGSVFCFIIHGLLFNIVLLTYGEKFRIDDQKHIGERKEDVH